MLTDTAEIPVAAPAAPNSRTAATAAWCLYDWAISPYPTIVSTFIISNYFARVIVGDAVAGSAQWGYMLAVAGIMIATFSPPLGAIADRMGHAKRGIAIGVSVLILSGGLLWFGKPDPAYRLPVLIVSGMGIVAMELAMLFYNALLPGVAPASRIGRVSGWGWASGYVGGLTCLSAALVLLVLPEHPIFGIPKAEFANIRATGPLTAIWAALFAWPLFFLVKDIPASGLKMTTAIRRGLVDLWSTLGSLGRTPQLAWFLIASAIYRDGVTTILGMGGLYAGGTFGMTLDQLIMFGIGLNVTAGLGAGTFAWLDDWIGSKRTIMLSVLGLIVFGAGIVIVHDIVWFIGLALALGVFVGPAQAASRSLAVRLAPPGEVGKVFGLYALTGRAVTFVGPTMFATVTETTHSQRAGMASILLLLMLGFAVLTKVREPKRA